MTTDLELTRADFQTDQEVRWCPGCGDYTILASVQNFLAEPGIEPEKHVFISGIGCASRFPYYMNTYGMHSIHGRAPAIATGVAVSNPDLNVWVIVGDGDGLSIGGNHLIHTLRRNVNLKILLFNNQIYGLTKGQYSPTSELGKRTKSSPMGSLDYPFNPVSLAIGAEATFVARTIDMDRKHTTTILEAAADHKGTAFVEIYQNCNVFNDGAFDAVRDKTQKERNQIRLEAGEQITFGVDGERAVVRDDEGRLSLADVADLNGREPIVHRPDDPDPSQAFALAQLAARPSGPTPVGIFRSIDRPVYAEDARRDLAENRKGLGDKEITELLHSGDTWTVD